MIIISIIIVCATCVLITSKVMNTLFELVHGYFDNSDSGSIVQKKLEDLAAQLNRLEDRHAELSAKTRQAMGWK